MLSHTVNRPHSAPVCKHGRVQRVNVALGEAQSYKIPEGLVRLNVHWLQRRTRSTRRFA